MTRSVNITPEAMFHSDGDFEEPPFHLITTDHPYMATLGLSTFTTGTLYRWWNQKDGEGNYENHKYFETIAPPPPPAIDPNADWELFPKRLLLGEDDTDFGNKESEIGKNQFAFHAWRNESADAEGRRAGKFEIKYIDDGTDTWTFDQEGDNENGFPRDYDYNDTGLNDTFNIPFIGFDFDSFLDENLDWQTTFDIPDGRGGEETVDFKRVAPITNVIVLNDYVRDLELRSLLRDGWTTQDFARHEFILDIYSSKEGYVEWSGLVSFNLKFADNKVDCIKKEWVKYRLHIFPNSAPKSTRRGIAMATPTFVGPPVDSLGRKYQKREDGRFSAFPEGSEAAKIAADLDMTYNAYTNKWEAGSKQMIGIVTQEIPKAQILTIKQLRELTPEQMLASPSDPNSHIIWGSGSAMPINQQNANPMQWTPNYVEPAEINEEGKFEPICPKDDPKVELRVFNASAKVLGSGQTVLLNQIDGQWFSIDFLPTFAEDEDADVDAGFEGRWEFSYCATNVVHHFRDRSFHQIDSDDIVQGFHKKYYKDDILNRSTNEEAFDIDKLIRGGYHQFTSFDMMDKDIGGTRDMGFNLSDGKPLASNAYATTNSQIAANGDEIETDNDGEHTGAFFGCLFPDGYDSEQIQEYWSDRPFDARPTIALSGFLTDATTNNSAWEPTAEFSSVGGISFEYFNKDGILRNVGPFANGDDRNDCTRGHYSLGDIPGEPLRSLAMFDGDDDSKLTNLPADIATNAAPSGKNGQPIQNLHMIELMYLNHAGGVLETSKDARNVFLYGQNWLRRGYAASTKTYPDGVHMESSAFDFSPKRSNHIVFRPLKAEVYAQFSQNGNIPYIGDGAGGGKNTERGQDRRNFGGEMCTHMISRKKPSSHIAHYRELVWDRSQGISITPPPWGGGVAGTLLGTIYPIYNSHWGLQLNIDIPGRKDWDQAFQNPNIKFELSPNAYLPNNGAIGRFRHDVWGRETNGWCHGVPGAQGNWPPWHSYDLAPAGAVGIIGAVASCTANENIKLVANYRLGAWSWGAYGGVGKVDQEPAWGKLNDYDKFQTTLLALKIYHAWPREDTIYDPRYFAVHHFNAGILGFYDDGEPIKNTTIEAVSQRDDTGTSKKYDYEIDQPIYNVDYRIPSAKIQWNCTIPSCSPNDNEGVIGGPDNNKPVLLASDTPVWSDKARVAGGVPPVGAGGQPSPTLLASYMEMLPYKQWNVDTTRRGKLLPYRYAKNTIRAWYIRNAQDSDGNDESIDVPYDYWKYAQGGYVIYWDENTSTTEVKDFGGSSTSTAANTYNHRHEITNGHFLHCVVRSPGEGYAVGDTFTLPDTIAKGFVATVTTVDGLGVCETGPCNVVGVGRVTGLTFTDQGKDYSHRGTDFSHTSFLKFDSDISYSSKNGIMWQPLNTAEGTGFQAFLVFGKTQIGSFFPASLVAREATDTDLKPEPATRSEWHQISPHSNNDDTTDGEPFGLIEGSEPNEILIDNSSDDRKYDLFFRFHNDISHTLLSNDHKGALSRWCNAEQYIDLTITTT